MAILLSSLVATGGETEGLDAREFKNWQDFCGQISGHSNCTIGQSTRVVNGSTVNRQQSSATFTVPSGVSKVRITMVGGGGGGGCYGGTYYGGAGGGGACFASGEYNVNPGETLNVTAGNGGKGVSTQASGGNGGSSSVTDNSTGGSRIAISASGGTGGGWTSTVGSAGGSHSVGGSALVTGTVASGHGGPGGQGSSNSFGYGPEGYAAGGGGSAGSFLGAGYRGGHGDNGGYTYASGGGGGIGGRGGRGYGSNSTSITSTYQDHAGAGGGSGGQGQDGTTNNGPYRSQGGDGRFGTPRVQDFDSGTNSTVGRAPLNWAQQNNLMRNIHGARYGDGENTGPRMHELSGGGYRGDVPGKNYVARGSVISGASSQYDMRTNTADGGAPLTGQQAKSYNGVFGRLWGGGGGGAPCHDDNFGYYNHSGGDGGTGAGGGGAAGSTTSYNSGTISIHSYSDWDWANLAMRSHDTAWENNGYRINGNGGHGGALGGGGGGVYYGMAGAGGIGGGGGGAGGHYSGSSNVQYSGPGGPGYVLIEW